MNYYLSLSIYFFSNCLKKIVVNSSINVSKETKYLDKSLEILLYATTAGIATKRPSAVANNASAIPGATTDKLVF